MRIAMWSGPRNLSTAMMYSFGARADCAVVDEPFYAAYLAQTGLEHPMGAEILAGMEQDPAKVESAILGPIPAQKPILYQKQMCHHMVPEFDRAWMEQIRNVFLIRHPARVVASYAAKREHPTLEDIGFVQQAEIYAELKAAGAEPLVIDSHDIRQDPERMLRKLCAALSVEFDPAMLAWPAGGHPDDGIWAPHWYDAVHRSTGFAGVEGELPRVDGKLAQVVQAALPYYERLSKDKIGL